MHTYVIFQEKKKLQEILTSKTQYFNDFQSYKTVPAVIMLFKILYCVVDRPNLFHIESHVVMIVTLELYFNYY